MSRGFVRVVGVWLLPRIGEEEALWCVRGAYFLWEGVTVVDILRECRWEAIQDMSLR